MGLLRKVPQVVRLYGENLTESVQDVYEKDGSRSERLIVVFVANVNCAP
jgi:hypothetical protein